MAILPFKIFRTGSSSESGDEFLGIGLADALVSRLSGMQRLIVRPTSSVLRFDEINHALEFDPLTPYLRQTLNWTIFHAGQAEEAIDSTRRMFADEPNYALSHFFLSSVLWHVKRYGEAIKVAQRGIDLLGRIPYSLCWLASAYAAAGEKEKALALIREIESMSVSRYVSPYLTAMIYSNLGDKQRRI